MERADLTSIPPQSQDWPGRVDDLDPQPDHGEFLDSGLGRLRGKRALVTGGDSGIGRATALAFAREGAAVAITHLPEEDADAAVTRDLVERAGGTLLTIEADLRTHEACHDVADQVLETLGGLDVLVCNAAFQMTHDDVTEFPPDQVARTFETNVFATFWLVHELTPHLQPGSSITVTTSVQAFQPSSHLLDYAASKAALNNLVVNLAQELGPKGVRVNAVAPGPIWTPLIPATMAPDNVAGFGTDTPLGRAGHPAEVANAFVFLASDEASYVSGTVLGVTGGKPVF